MLNRIETLSSTTKNGEFRARLSLLKKLCSHMFWLQEKKHVLLREQPDNEKNKG
jgi:hypothetical protein